MLVKWQAKRVFGGLFRWKEIYWIWGLCEPYLASLPTLLLPDVFVCALPLWIVMLCGEDGYEMCNK